MTTLKLNQQNLEKYFKQAQSDCVEQAGKLAAEAYDYAKAFATEDIPAYKSEDFDNQVQQVCNSFYRV